MRSARIFLAAFLFAASTLEPVAAQNKGSGKGPRSAPSQSQEALEALGQVPVGLVPIYPAKVACPEVSSFFGSSVRYDGSARVNDHYGFHNGIDITAPQGTPLLAVADGEVIHAGTAGMLVGNYVWLRHTPEDSALPVYLFTRYQHLDEPSPLSIGTRVKMGDVVARAGKTGTVGGYFGPTGYSHLHLLVFAADAPDFSIREAVVFASVQRRYLDPLAIYAKPTDPFDNHTLMALPDELKRVAIPYQTKAGIREPADTKLIWPLACEPR